MAGMKLATFEVQTPIGRFVRSGIALHSQGNERLIDLTSAYTVLLLEEGAEPDQALRQAEFLLPPDMRRILENGQAAMDAARLVHDRFTDIALGPEYRDSFLSVNGARLIFGLEEVTLKCPVPNPKMLRDFLSFEVHVQAGADKRGEPISKYWYEMPVYYKGNPNTVVGHNEPAIWPHYTRRFDYELELACIIGKGGRDIPVEKAHEHIAGYAVMNDFSARDIQKGEMICRLGPAKGKDFATAVGPYLVTKDEVGDARNLRMTAKINGELWSDGNSGTSHWTFEQMIAHISMEEDLYPGDIIGSGTVGNGCGFELDRWPQPGDVMELEIEKLGVLRNQVVESPGQPQESAPYYQALAANKS